MFAATHKLFTLFAVCCIVPSAVCMAQDSAINPPAHVPQHLPGLPTFPEFPGGKDSMAAFIKKHTRYPHAARRHNITGTVEVDFWVNEQGNISKIHVLKPLGYGCDKEAMRVVKKMPKWKPGMSGPKPIGMDFHVDITFGETDKK